MIRQAPATQEEYYKELERRLTLLEQFTGAFTATDERLDLANLLLIDQKDILRTAVSSLQRLEALLTYLAQQNPVSTVSQRLIVDTAGTAKQMPWVQVARGHAVTIKALTANVGTIYIGNTRLEAEDTTLGFPLDAGEGMEYYVKNLSQLWVNSDTASEGIVWATEREDGQV